jgi:hypothetical protein
MKGHLSTIERTDVLSVTTSPPVSLLEASRQLEYSPLLEEFFHDGAETCIPCPNELFDGIIQINYLRAVSIHSVCDDSSGISFAISVQSLLQRILSFPATAWAERKAFEYGAGTAVTLEKPIPGFLQPSKDNWLRIASVYHAATILYGIRSLALDIPSLLLEQNPLDPASPHITVETLHETMRQTLSQNIRAIFSSQKEDQRILTKVIVWPLFVAGIEAGDSQDGDEEKEFIASALRSLTTRIASLNLRDTERFLSRYWRQNSYSSSFYDRRRWDEIFAGVQGRCAFFM